MILFQKIIYRHELQINPDRSYVFGDNLERQGMGGQAKNMRYEPNAIGVATKVAPSNMEFAFFSDQLYEIAAVTNDLARVDAALKAGRVVVVPRDGIGTGLSELAPRSPLIYEMIRAFFGARITGDLPW